MSSFNRRGFLKTGITGAAGAITLGPRLNCSAAEKKQRNIITRSLGKTGLKLPVISHNVSHTDNPSLVKTAWENGVILFDTENDYNNGKSESLLGEVLNSIPRETILIAAKIKPAGVKDGRPSELTTAEDLIGKLENSLNRLKVEYIDILYIQDVSTLQMLHYEPILAAVSKLRSEGKIRYAGFSTHSNMSSVIDEAAVQNIWDVILTTYNFKLSNLPSLNKSIRKASATGIGIAAMQSMAGGGYLDKEKTKTINSSAALKWVLSNPDISTVVAGMTTFDQLDSNLGVMENISLSAKELEDLEFASGQSGLSCTLCNSCLKNCTLNLPVPELMRSFMYAYGYSDMQRAYKILGDLGTGSSPCANCEACKIECGGNFNLRDRISDISRLVNVPSDFII